MALLGELIMLTSQSHEPVDFIKLKQDFVQLSV